MSKYTFPVQHLAHGRRKYLRDFISAWIDWAEAGAPTRHNFGSGVPFMPSHGLCLAAHVWDAWHDSVPGERGSPSGVTELELKRLLKGQDDRGEVICMSFPFNSLVNEQGHPDGKEYFVESRNMACHENIKRLEWARGLLAALERTE